ncbi:hypothetical protein D3C78_1320770 [compost metagenome]
MVLGHLVQAGEVLDDPVVEQRPPPEAAGRAVDQVQLATLVDQQVAPLEVVVGKAVLVHAPGRLGQLAADLVQPVVLLQARVVVARQRSQVLGARQLGGDQRATGKAAETALQPPGHHRRGGNPPLGEQAQVLPLGLDPRPAQPATQALAGAPVLLDVVAPPIDLDAQHLGHLVGGDPFPLKGEHPVQIGKRLARRCGQLGRQLPVAHAEAPGAYLRR